MLTRVDGKVAFVCDGCGDVYETEETDALEALAVIRTAGWEHRRDRDGWIHFCQNCPFDEAV